MNNDVWKCGCGNFNLQCLQTCPKCGKNKNYTNPMDGIFGGGYMDMFNEIFGGK